ncbi:HepT-like ribonuclease domain-containing protein [Petrachloros mirabilis]
MKKDDTLYLIHIGECIGRIESYTRGMDEEGFLAAEMVQDAVIRNLQTLAESTQRLSARAKESRPEIGWYKIAGFRNILVHDYLGVDLQRVWDIVQNDLPVLKSAVDAMLGPNKPTRPAGQ